MSFLTVTQIVNNQTAYNRYPHELVGRTRNAPRTEPTPPPQHNYKHNYKHNYISRILDSRIIPASVFRFIRNTFNPRPTTYPYPREIVRIIRDEQRRDEQRTEPVPPQPTVQGDAKQRCCGYCRKPGHTINKCQQIQDEMIEMDEFCRNKENQKDIEKTRAWLESKPVKLISIYIQMTPQIKEHDASQPFLTDVELLIYYYCVLQKDPPEFDAETGVPIASIITVTAEPFITNTAYVIETYSAEDYYVPVVETCPIYVI